MVQIFGTKKCKDSRAAQRFFAERRVPVQVVDLAEKGLSKGELSSVARAVGGYSKLYDPAKDPNPRRVAPTEAQLEKLLVENPTWLRTPIVRDGPAAAVGPAEAVWASFVEAARQA